MLEYGFMRNAMAAVLIITPLFGMLGTMIVNKKMAFFSDALGHSALTGIGLGAILGMADIHIAMTVFAIVFALFLNYIGRKNKSSTDTVISVFSSFSTAIGLAILSRGGNFSQYSGVLVGDILSITKKEIFYLLLLWVLALAFYGICFNWLSAATMHKTLAKSRNIPSAFAEYLFAVFLAVVVALSIRWVGILIINALLILPAAASRNISKNMREYHLFSILFSVCSGMIGLLVSYYGNVATGPMIVIVASALYFFTYLFCKNK